MAEGPLHSGLQNRSPLCLALKGEPLTRETASKTDEKRLSIAPERFFSCLVFATVATALYQLGIFVHHCPNDTNFSRRNSSTPP